MRLVNYGVGEIVDRLTILELKLAHGGGVHFSTERAALIVQLHGRTSTNGAWFEHAVTLAITNGLIWHAEDALRSTRRQTEKWDNLEDRGVYDVARIAYTLQELNDRRAGLIEQINRLTGDHLGSEKL